VAFVGESRSTTVNPSDQWLRKMNTVVGAWYFATWEWPEITAFVTDRALPAESLITHRYNLDEAEEAFRAFDARETGKAIFTP
jgi:propanol-preferring alcohol dehydrogenase